MTFDKKTDRLRCALPVDHLGEKHDCRNGKIVKHTELLQGTLDMLILRTLERESMHGWGVSRRIEERSADVLRVNQGSLYPALHRLERRGWIRSEWGVSSNNRRAKYYELTPRGRKQLSEKAQEWGLFVSAVQGVLGEAGG